MTKINTLKPTITQIDTRQGSSVAVERIRGRRLQQERERIALRDEYTCRVCGRTTALEDGEVDHICPLHLGGGNNDENKQWICKEPCHRLKTEREEAERA